MKITFRQRGNENDAGAHFDAETTVDVDSNEDAELLGQEFARLVHHLEIGAYEYESAVHGSRDDS